MLDNITLFLIINIINGAGYSLINPLLPILGKKENLSESALGWMIGIFPISSCIITTMVPYLGKKFSRVKLLSVGTFLASITTILYGFLIFISNKTLLIVIIFILRIFHGFCSTIVAVLINSLTIATAKKGNTQSSLGKAEIALSIGVSAGPVICSIFYKIGGYPLPFFVTGVFSFLSVCLTFQVNAKKIKKNKEEEKDDNTNYNYLKYLIYPEVFSVLFGFVVCMIGVTFYIPCLTYHLINKYSISVSVASLFFMAPMISYVLILQFLDNISGKLGIYLTITLGLIISGIAALFPYPVPPLPRSPIIIILGFFMMGFGSVPVFVPGIILFSRNIKKIDDSIDEMSANDIAAAMSNLFVELGNFAGPIIGGYLTDLLGFKKCCIIVSIFVITYSAIFTLYFYNKMKIDFCKLCCNKDLENNENSNEEELIEKYNDNYLKRIKAYILINRYSDRMSSSSFNNNGNNYKEKNSLSSSLTK
jgi:MFS family permease